METTACAVYPRHDAHCVVKTQDGYAVLLYVCGAYKSASYWLDEDGNCIHAYGNKEGEDLGDAYHMIATSDGSLIVADHGKNKLLHFGNHPDSHPQCLLSDKDGIQSPRCVYLDEKHGRLYVAHCPSRYEVRVYEWSVVSPKTDT